MHTQFSHLPRSPHSSVRKSHTLHPPSLVRETSDSHWRTEAPWKPSSWSQHCSDLWLSVTLWSLPLQALEISLSPALDPIAGFLASSPTLYCPHRHQEAKKETWGNQENWAHWLRERVKSSTVEGEAPGKRKSPGNRQGPQPSGEHCLGIWINHIALSLENINFLPDNYVQNLSHKAHKFPYYRPVSFSRNTQIQQFRSDCSEIISYMVLNL